MSSPARVSVSRCSIIVERFDARHGQSLGETRTTDGRCDVVFDQLAQCPVLSVRGDGLEAVSVPLRNSSFRVHRKFVLDRKAGIRFLRAPHLQVLLSNADVDQLKKLVKFLRTLKAGLRSLEAGERPSPPRRVRSRAESAALAASSTSRRRQRGSSAPRSSRPSKRRREAPAARLLETVNLSRKQREVVKLVMAGKSIFFGGPGGTGKTFLLHHLLKVLDSDTTFATATTGIAAVPLNGTTLYMWAGISAQEKPVAEMVRDVFRSHANVQRWRKTKTLIIDECSMLDGRLFDKLEECARIIRGSNKPFGGIQILVSGDFFQLPPVTGRDTDCCFLFQAQSWDRVITHSVELDKIYRQAGDGVFIELLNRMRVGLCSPEMEAVVKTQCVGTRSREAATRLLSKRHEVAHVNQRELAQLPGELVEFAAKDSGNTALLSKQRAKKSLQLKQGAQVMLLSNLNVRKGAVNGARGEILRFERGLPFVRLHNGHEQLIARERFTVRLGEQVIATREQLPLALAYAISIHKSQGLTLESAQVSLGSVFEFGQTYTALSRCKSLDGLCVFNFSAACVRAHPRVLQFYKEKVWQGALPYPELAQQ